MNKYYILSVDSFQDAFTRIDAGKEFYFEFTVQNSSNILSELKNGDYVIIFRKNPVSAGNIIVQVADTADSKTKFRKILEVAEIILPNNPGYDLENEYLTEISAEQYSSICMQMVAGIQGLASASVSGHQEDLKTKEEFMPRITCAENVLLYGVPGVGKSREIRTRYCDDPERMERVVFHPDYTYSDFVGQILPKVENDKLKYEFTAGPFTTLLEKAWNNPGKKFYLVIEEINRGNAPAIFGEIFQLLDRKTEDDHQYDPSEYGESEYSITNSDIASAVFGNPDEKIRIPSNMWILATMNTADQNVFTLDTAFQRRWKLYHMKNDVMSAGHSKTKIGGTEIEWGTFASVINEMVTDYSVEMMSSEDKRLGAYFVQKSELSNEEFPEKVLKYLWDDAFKMKREAVFDDKFKSLETVIETYEMSEPDKLRAVLRPEVYQKMLNKQRDNNKEEQS